jgi:hypothetical protein
MRNKIAWMLILLFWLTAAAAADEKTKAFEQNKLLEAELALAKTSATYLVMNFSENSISLKSRGIVLKKWEIRKATFWGQSVPIKALGLLKKSAWFPPKRKNIVPGKEVQGDVDLEVLELKEMPSRYRLTFSDRTYISIRPRTRKFFSFLGNIGTSIGRLIILPLKALRFSMRKKRFTEIELVLAEEKDTKGLYWSFLEGQSCIIYWPKK